MTRRRAWILLGATIVGLPGAAPEAVAGAPSARPGIVVILADDLGFSDLGCYGSEIATPNLDALARDGVRFRQFYNGARCCPTRAALLTGLYAHQAGVGHMVGDRGTPAYRGRLAGDAPTVAECLRASGYRTYMSGKWHLGEKRPHWPVDRGFERFYGLVSGASSYFEIDETRTFAEDGEARKGAFRAGAAAGGGEEYLTDAITEKAVAFLDEHARLSSAESPPFFLYVAYTAPHWPLHARAEDIERYLGKYRSGWDATRAERLRRMREVGIAEPGWEPSPRPPRIPAWEEADGKEDWSLRMAVYAAQVDRMDRGIGRILASLDEHGWRENTLIVFLSDNGASPERIDACSPCAPAGSRESYLSYGEPWAWVSNGPFRLGKARVHEGGIASPFIARWPARIHGAGRVLSDMGHVIDIVPTCLAAAGAAPLQRGPGGPARPLEGRSLLPVLEGGGRVALLPPGHSEPSRVLFWEHQGNRAVRRDRWKLVQVHGRPWELYDVESDRTELHDLANEKPAFVAELEQLYASWAERCGVLPWRRRARL